MLPQFKRFLFAATIAASIAVSLSFSSWADTCDSFFKVTISKKLNQISKLDPGSGVQIDMGSKGKLNGYFLGRLLSVQGETTEAAFFITDGGTVGIHYFKIEKLDLSEIENGLEDSFRVVRSFNQEGGTCAAYSLYNCMRQLDERKVIQGDAFSKEMVDEDSRTHLIVRAVNHIYADSGSSFEGAIRKWAEKYSLKLNVIEGSGVPNYFNPFNWFQPKSKNAFRDSILKEVVEGRPVLIRFDCPKNMTTCSYSMVDNEKASENVVKLWLPKNEGETKSAGHAVVLTGIFSDSNGKTFLLVSDPNWQVVRLWNVEELDKVDAANMKAWSFK